MNIFKKTQYLSGGFCLQQRKLNLGIISIFQLSVTKSHSALLEILLHEKGFGNAEGQLKKVPE